MPIKLLSWLPFPLLLVIDRFELSRYVSIDELQQKIIIQTIEREPVGQVIKEIKSLLRKQQKAYQGEDLQEVVQEDN